MRRGWLNWLLKTPNSAGFRRSNVGSANSTRFKMLKKSKLKRTLTISLTAMALPTEKSIFQCGSPRSTPRPLRLSRLSKTGRKVLNTASGSAKRFNPVPPRAGSPAVPTLPEPVTPRWISFPNFGFLMGIAPVPKEKVVPPPKTCVLCTTVRGAPLKAVKMPPVNHPPISLSTQFPALKRRLGPNGSSQYHVRLAICVWSKNEGP